MKRTLAITLTALVSVSLLAACSDDDDGDSASDVIAANTEFCTSLASYGDSLADFGELDSATATKADYDEAADAVRSARSDLAESAGDLVEAELENLEAQWDDLDGFFEEAADDAAVADIVEAAQAEVAEVRVSVSAFNTAVCTPADSDTSEDTDTTEG